MRVVGMAPSILRGLLMLADSGLSRAVLARDTVTGRSVVLKQIKVGATGREMDVVYLLGNN